MRALHRLGAYAMSVRHSARRARRSIAPRRALFAVLPPAPPGTTICHLSTACPVAPYASSVPHAP
eukprot:947245-Rhodomonas_salina.1